MRQSVLYLTLLCLTSSLSTLYAQGPRARAILMGPPAGPGLAPGYGFRPPMPPIPVPTVRIPQPSYLRVPGVAIMPAPRIMIPVPTLTVPTYGYYRSTTVVAAPSYSAARVAVVQPTVTPNPTGAYSAGSYNYRTAPAAPTARPIGNSTSSDLRPGMVLPDGAVVVSVGQPGGPASTSQSPTPAATSTPYSTQLTPMPSPAANEGEPRSILENAEELPRPQSDGETAKPPTRQF